jgi:hypothetical protein
VVQRGAVVGRPESDWTEIMLECRFNKTRHHPNISNKLLFFLLSQHVGIGHKEHTVLTESVSFNVLFNNSENICWHPFSREVGFQGEPGEGLSKG